MKKEMLESVSAGSNYSGILLVKSSKLLPTKAGKLYLDIELVDKTGRIKAKLWDATKKESELFKPNAFFAIRGFVSEYRGELQLKIDGFTQIDESEVDISDFLPTSRFPISDMLGFLARTGESLKSPHYQELWKTILLDQRFIEDFSICPAAMSYHHVFAGGLLEHTCEVIRLCDAIAAIRPELNRELLLTGAFLHDIGKIQEYSKGPAFVNLDRGLLLGHIYIGTELFEDWVAELEEFPNSDIDLIKHIILSHHGIREYGAPIEPSFPEAIVVHFADNIDAKINNMRATIAEDTEDGDFTAKWSRMLSKRILKTTLLDEPDGYNPFAEPEEEEEVVNESF